MIKTYQYESGDDIFSIQVDLQQVTAVLWSVKRGEGHVFLNGGLAAEVTPSCAKRIAVDRAKFIG